MDTGNGGPAAAFDSYVTEAQRGLDSIVADLRVQLQVERDLERRLNEQLEGSRERRKRMEKTVELLVSEKPRRQHPTPKVGDWQISDQKVDEVWQLVRDRSDTFTATTLANETPGLSHESVRRAFKVLRERELVRVAGRSKGGGTLLAVMPGATDAA